MERKLANEIYLKIKEIHSLRLLGTYLKEARLYHQVFETNNKKLLDDTAWEEYEKIMLKHEQMIKDEIAQRIEEITKELDAL